MLVWRYLMSSSSLREKIITFLELKDELESLDKRIEYIQTLLYEARKKLSVKEIEEINRYIMKLNEKLDELEAYRREIISRINEISPDYYKFIKLANKIVEYFTKQRDSVLNNEISLADFRKKNANVSEKIEHIISTLRQEKDYLEKLLVEDLPLQLKDRIRDEIESIDENLKLLEKIEKILSPEITLLKKAYKLLGLKIQFQGDSELLGTITDVYIRRDDFEIILEISRENELSSSDMEKLLKDLAVELGTQSLDDFTTLMRTAAQEIGEEPLIIPTTVRKVLRKRNIPISKNIEKILTPKYTRIGFLELRTLLKEIQTSKDRIFIDYKALQKIENTIKAPSIIKISQDLLLKHLRIMGNTYTIYSEVIVPNLGRVLILLQRDDKNEPMPDPAFLRRFLNIIKRIRKDLFETLGITPDIEKLSDEDICWITRLLIVKGLSGLKNVTESNALRPNLLFTFCLRYGIPMFYEEILQSYFSIVESYNISFKDARLGLRVERKPYPLSKYFNRKILAPFLPDNCVDLLGTTVRRDGVSIHCLEYLDENTMNSLIEEYKIPSKLTLTIEDNPKKLLRAIILSQKIKSLDEYLALKKKLRVMIINYHQIEDKIGRSSEDLLQRTLLENL